MNLEGKQNIHPYLHRNLIHFKVVFTVNYCIFNLYYGYYFKNRKEILNVHKSNQKLYAIWTDKLTTTTFYRLLLFCVLNKIFTKTKFRLLAKVAEKVTARQNCHSRNWLDMVINYYNLICETQNIFLYRLNNWLKLASRNSRK